jgi:Rrf2 family cysteine metabolism transcriptional repressor
MWHLSTKGRYGTRLMIQLAISYGEGPLMLKNIARWESLSVKYLEQIVSLLKSANLIDSARGPGGGYQLNRHPDKISLREILEVLEGDIVPTYCVVSPQSCERSKRCAARDAWIVLGERIIETMDEITLADMIKNEQAKP